MTQDEAEKLIAPAVPSNGGTWADFGAGRGLFSRALSRLIGPQGIVFAIDRDKHALAAVRSPEKVGAPITPVRGDFRDMSAIHELEGVRLDGALFANSLHYTPAPGGVLSDVERMLREDGRAIVVEYERSVPSRWVPHPIPSSQLAAAASSAGLRVTEVVGRRASAFGGSMYCALLERVPGRR